MNQCFPHSPKYWEARQTLFDNIQSIDKMLSSQKGIFIDSLTFLLWP